VKAAVGDLVGLIGALVTGLKDGLATDTTGLPEGLAEDRTGLPEGLAEDTTGLPEGLAEDLIGLLEGLEVAMTVLVSITICRARTAITSKNFIVFVVGANAT
jgi:hypothetical protein